MNVIPVLMQITAVKERKCMVAWKMQWKGKEFSPLPWFLVSKPSWVTALLLIENGWRIFYFLSVSDLVLWSVCSRAARCDNLTLITVLKFVFYPGNTRIPIHSDTFTKCCRGIDVQHLCGMWFPFSGWSSGMCNCIKVKVELRTEVSQGIHYPWTP